MFENIDDLMEAENKRRRENCMSLVFHCNVHRGQIYGEIKLSNPVKIGYKKNGKYYLFSI